MKKAIIVLMVIFTVVISSCKKDDNNDNNLTGTTYVGNETSDGRNYTYTLKFTSSTVCTFNMAVEGVDILFTGTYTYVHPAINITLVMDGESTLISGTVKGNTIVLTDNGDTMVFTKQ